MNNTTRLIGAIIWLILLAIGLFWVAPYARAQGKAQTLCTPLYNSSGGLIGCPVVGMTGGTTTAPYSYNWLPVGGLANATAPTYTEGRLSGLSFDLSGNLRVLGTFTPSASSPEFTPVAPATATATVGVLLGGQYDSTQKTLTNGQQAALSASPRGALYVATGADAFTAAITAASGSFASGAFASGSFASGSHASGSFASGAFASGSVASGALASGSIASGAMVDLVALSAPVAPATATATKSVLLGAQATTAAVNPTTGQQSALSSDTNNNLLVSPGGAPNLSISQVSIATSDTLAIAARSLRRSVTIQQITGTQNVFCNQTTATAANGVVLPAVVGASITLNTTSAVRCIAVTGAQTVAVAETY